MNYEAIVDAQIKRRKTDMELQLQEQLNASVILSNNVQTICDLYGKETLHKMLGETLNTIDDVKEALNKLRQIV